MKFNKIENQITFRSRYYTFNKKVTSKKLAVRNSKKEYKPPVKKEIENDCLDLKDFGKDLELLIPKEKRGLILPEGIDEPRVISRIKSRLGDIDASHLGGVSPYIPKNSLNPLEIAQKLLELVRKKDNGIIIIRNKYDFL